MSFRSLVRARGAAGAVDVSVLLPFRDAAETIDAALDGLLAEDFPALEVLAVDDGSRDDGPRRVAARAATDPRTRLLATAGVGIVAALHRGAEAARAPFLARMDADDLSLPGRVTAALYRLRRDPGLGAVACPVRAETLEGGPVEGGLARFVAWQNGLRSPEEHRRARFVESPLCHPATVFRRAAFDAVGGFRDGLFPEDYDLFLRLAAAGWGLAKTDEVGLVWRHRPGRLTFSDPRYGLEAMRRLKARHLRPVLAGDARALALWGAGPTGRRFARALEEEIGVRPDRFIDTDPHKVGGVARGSVPIAAPDGLRPNRDRVLVALGRGDARDQVRAHLDRHGFVEGEGYLCVS